MIVELHNIKPSENSHRRVKRVGRGHGTGRGSYSGRGGKGQTARSGGGKRTAIRAFKPMLQRMPKLRGFNSITAKKETVTLFTLDRITKENDTVTPEFLKEKNVIGSLEKGVKIVATGELKHKITVQNCSASKNAIQMIEKAGGKIVL